MTVSVSRHFTIFILAIAMCSVGGCTTTAPEAPSERARIKPIRYAGWKHCIELKNEHMRVVIVPSVGRIMHISLTGRPNMLRLDPELAGKRLPRGEPFVNIGGDWLWPVAQSQWDAIAEANWPPPEALAEAPWKANAWVNKDGSQSCLLMRGYDAPVHSWVTRVITLDRRLPRIRIRQRALQAGPSIVPFSLWNITQLTQPVRAFLPAGAQGTADILPMIFGDPPRENWVRCNDTIVYNALQAGQYKLGIPGTNAWIAAETRHALILERAFNASDGPYPDGGCPVELYLSPNSEYVEIETLSPESSPSTGESLENTLVIECHPFDHSLDDCEAGAKVLDILGGLTP